MAQQNFQEYDPLDDYARRTNSVRHSWLSIVFYWIIAFQKHSFRWNNTIFCIMLFVSYGLILYLVMTLICLQNWVPALKAYLVFLMMFIQIQLCAAFYFLEQFHRKRHSDRKNLNKTHRYKRYRYIHFLYEFSSIKFITWLRIFSGLFYFQYRYFSSNYGENHPGTQASHPGLLEKDFYRLHQVTVSITFRQFQWKYTYLSKKYIFEINV